MHRSVPEPSRADREISTRHSDPEPLRVRLERKDRDGRQAWSRLTKTTGPIWFGDGKLATDLSLPNLRHRWEHSGTDTKTIRIQALAA